MSRTSKPRTIYTIGYEGTDIDRFIRTLLAAGIEVLADVRAIPLSRKKGFSKNSLKAHLEQAGIVYEPFKELGDPKPGRDAARAGRFDDFRRIYSAHIDSEEANDRVGDLAAIANSKVTCMLCFERDPQTCHRSIVGERLGGYGIQPFDLFGDDPTRYERHRHLLPTNALPASA